MLAHSIEAGKSWPARVKVLALMATVAVTLSACSDAEDKQLDVGASPLVGAEFPAGREGQPGVAEGAHLNNPFAGADLYVNPIWSAQVEATALEYQGTDASLAANMRAVSGEPTAVWMDRIGAISGNADGPGLRYHLDEALAQRDGETPLAITVVIYNLPGRDCFALASNGELPATDEGFTRYQQEYIDVIASMFAEEKYAGLRIVTVIEPDSLPNLVTNSSEANCQQADPYYRRGVAYTLDAFAPLDNVYTYIDAAHSGWLGWDNNASGTVQLFAEVVRSTKAGFASVDGFVTNTANYTPLSEPFLHDGEFQVGGQAIKSSSFYEHNAIFDEARWATDLYSRLVAAGFPSDIGMIVDTSRNGWGGDKRPGSVSTSGDLETYIRESKIDQRGHRGSWCNAAGAGLGLRPQALPSGYASAHLDAILWIKPPGESDGSSREIANDEGKSFDPMCDPLFSTDRLGGQSTNALADAPVSGKWFAAQFAELVKNAYPAIGTPAPAPREDPAAFLPVGEAGTGVSGGGQNSSNGDSGNNGNNGSTGNKSGGEAPGGSTGGNSNGGAQNAPAPAPTWKASDLDSNRACSAYLGVTNTWQGGFQADVTVVGHRDIKNWSVTVNLPAGTAVDGLWNGSKSGTTGRIKVSNVDWNAALNRAGTASFGFTGTGAAPAAAVLECSSS